MWFVRKLNEIDAKLDEVLKILKRKPSPNGFKVSLKGETMPVKHTLDAVNLQFLDNGTVLAIATPTFNGSTTNPDGTTVVLPKGTSVLTFTDAAGKLSFVNNPDGLSAVGTPVQPSPDTTGDTITVSATLPDATVITGTTPPFDIIPVPVTEANPTGFAVVASQNPPVAMSQGLKK